MTFRRLLQAIGGPVELISALGATDTELAKRPHIWRQAHITR